MIHGKEEIAVKREYLGILIEMASAALFTREPSITMQNSEGAILFQLIFQIYAGSSCLDNDVGAILDKIRERMMMQPMQDHLKRHLLGVFLTAAAYNPNLTLAYLEANNLTAEFIKMLFQLSKGFTNLYERKIYVVGLSSLLNAQNMA